MGIYLSTPKTEKFSEDGENDKVRYGLSSMQGWRATMEDAHAALPNLDNSTSFFGVYDGHGGKVVAKFCAKYLHQQVLKHEAYSAGDVGTSVQKAFFRMDEMMRGQRGWRELSVLGDKINKFTGMIEGLIWSPRGGEGNDHADDWAFEEGPHSDFSGPTSGCTACVAIIRNNQLVVANAGDSRCVISRKGQAYNLSRDHKPDLEIERERILKAGGFIHAGRVNGSLNLARAIGITLQVKSSDLINNSYLLYQKNVTSLGIIKDCSTESRLNERKSEIKRLIEQLLMVENFSRDEIDRLTEIMNSRVVDHSRNDGLDEGLCVIPCGRTSNAYTSTPDVCNQAVTEARKWLKENKAVSSLQSDLDLGSRALFSAMKEHVNESEVGSPVDVARSYMRARPPWASPIKHSELRSPSPLATELFTEATPYLKRDSLSAGSWNIQEEIRKLRSKATEDMLRSRPSANLNISSFASEHKTSHYSSGPNESVEPMDTYNLSALGNSRDGAQNEALLSYPPLFVPGQNQDLEPIQTVEGAGDEFQSNHAAHPEIESGQHLGVAELKGAQNANGSAAFQFSLPADFVIEEKHGQTDEENPSPDRSCFNLLPDPGEGTCELLSEASIEIPTGNETIVNEFKSSSSSMPLEEPSSEPTHVNPASDFEETVGSIIEKQIGKKPSRYVRKGRGRGK